MNIPAWHGRSIQRFDPLFRYDHLPPHLQEVSRIFYDAAQRLVSATGPSEDETMLADALTSLWEAKNAAVVHFGFVADASRKPGPPDTGDVGWTGSD